MHSEFSNQYALLALHCTSERKQEHVLDWNLSSRNDSVPAHDLEFSPTLFPVFSVSFTREGRDHLWSPVLSCCHYYSVPERCRAPQRHSRLTVNEIQSPIHQFCSFRCCTSLCLLRPSPHTGSGSCHEFQNAPGPLIEFGRFARVHWPLLTSGVAAFREQDEF